MEGIKNAMLAIQKLLLIKNALLLRLESNNLRLELLLLSESV